jgi:hypothetical protein
VWLQIRLGTQCPEKEAKEHLSVAAGKRWDESGAPHTELWGGVSSDGGGEQNCCTR